MLLLADAWMELPVAVHTIVSVVTREDDAFWTDPTRTTMPRPFGWSAWLVENVKVYAVPTSNPALRFLKYFIRPFTIPNILRCRVFAWKKLAHF